MLLSRKIDFPEKHEYPAYAEMYMNLVKKDGSLLRQLDENSRTTKAFILSLSAEMMNFRPAKNKWSIKEIFIHIIDDERIYGYRALAFARNDQTSLPGFDQDLYAAHCDADERDTENILAEYEAVRLSTITLFAGLSETALLRIGTADDNNTSVRALGYHIAGHELHHLKIILDQYLPRYAMIKE